MYLDEVLFRQRTNREDFFEVFGLWDDDTGAPINLDGIISVAVAGQNFTSSAWTVTDGSIVTTSATQFTIPAARPIGGGLNNQLTALSLTVGAGLGIKAADPISIADTATGLNSVSGYVVSYAATTGVMVVQIGWTFQFEVRGESPNVPTSGYIPWYDFGT